MADNLMSIERSILMNTPHKIIASGPVARFDSSINGKLSSLLIQMPYKSDGITKANIFAAQDCYLLIPKTGAQWTDGNFTLDYLGMGNYHLYGGNASGGGRIPSSNAIDTESFIIPSGDGRRLYLNNTLASGSVVIYLRKSDYTAVDSWGFSSKNRETSYGGMAGKECGSFYILLGSAIVTTDLYFRAEFEKVRKWKETVNFPATIYGGTLDLVKGKIVSEYASDGSRLSNPVEYDIPKKQITITGKHAIWSDSGDTTAICWVH